MLRKSVPFSMRCAAKEWRNLRVAASGLMRDRSLAVLKMFSSVTCHAHLSGHFLQSVQSLNILIPQKNSSPNAKILQNLPKPRPAPFLGYLCGCEPQTGIKNDKP
jgi:hypothetical protein